MSIAVQVGLSVVEATCVGIRDTNWTAESRKLYLVKDGKGKSES